MDDLTAADIRRLMQSNAWVDHTMAHAAAAQYLRRSHELRHSETDTRPEYAWHLTWAGYDSPADLLDSAYWSELEALKVK
jgi:hypothetical protein